MSDDAVDRKSGTRWHAIASAMCFVLLAAVVLCNAIRFDPRTRVRHIELAVSDVEAAATFFTSVLGFERDGSIPRFPGVPWTRLRLGDEWIVLSGLPADRKPIAPRCSNDANFQHVAIVVADMDVAVSRLRANDVDLISDGPQTFPTSNDDAAGIRAVYFRDRDGHALELIQFPSSKGEPRWQRGTGNRLFLGIDHTAIVVQDTERSLAFYRDDLGMTVAGDSHNSGDEQAELTGVADATVRITTLRGTTGPGVELLEYLTPRTPQDSSTNDWAVTLDSKVSAVASEPDGHVLRVTSDRYPFIRDGKSAWQAHWSRYCQEAMELAAFMIVTLWATLLLEHPQSPVRRKIESAFVRRVLMGLIIGSTVILIIRSPMGRASGAHFNPSVTLAMLFKHRIAAWDAAFYILFQFIGGIVGVALAAFPFRAAAKHEKVNFAATLPGERGLSIALAGEAVISFVLFATLISIAQTPPLKPYVAYAAGVLLLIYITFEAPLSGMSMNPARTVASAIFARRLASTWLYFVVPIPSMLLAAWIFAR